MLLSILFLGGDYMFFSLPFWVQAFFIVNVLFVAIFCIYGLKGIDFDDVSPRARQVAAVMCYIYIIGTAIFMVDIWITCSKVYKESSKIIDNATNYEYYDGYLDGYYDGTTKVYHELFDDRTDEDD
jgi:hypothetical protein